jgi:hypothetical protein
MQRAHPRAFAGTHGDAIRTTTVAGAEVSPTFAVDARQACPQRVSRLCASLASQLTMPAASVLPALVTSVVPSATCTTLATRQHNERRGEVAAECSLQARLRKRRP